MPDSLKAHRKRHLDPTIPCSYCTKKFYTKNELRSHIGLHTGIKAFQCDLCTSAFVASSSLAAHRRKHKKDNILPTCKLCGTQFSDRVLLRMHLNDHKKDSPFEWKRFKVNMLKILIKLSKWMNCFFFLINADWYFLLLIAIIEKTKWHRPT